MHDTLQILTPLLFCLITGYMLSFVQRSLDVLERIEGRLTALQRQLSDPAMKQASTGDPVQDLLQTGLYRLGDPDKKTGARELISLQKPQRGVLP